MTHAAQRNHLDSLHSTSRNRGFTIAEILVALLVIGVGFIGIAALYSDQAQQYPGTQLHFRAAELADIMAERIRSTKEGHTGFATTVGVVCTPKARPKLPQDMAAQSAACWEDEVERRLPSGSGSITRDTSTTPPTYVIAVSWSSPQSGTASYVIRVNVEPS